MTISMTSHVPEWAISTNLGSRQHSLVRETTQCKLCQNNPWPEKSGKLLATTQIKPSSVLTSCPIVSCTHFVQVKMKSILCCTMFLGSHLQELSLQMASCKEAKSEEANDHYLLTTSHHSQTHKGIQLIKRCTILWQRHYHTPHRSLAIVLGEELAEEDKMWKLSWMLSTHCHVFTWKSP